MFRMTLFATWRSWASSSGSAVVLKDAPQVAQVAATGTRGGWMKLCSSWTTVTGPSVKGSISPGYELGRCMRRGAVLP